MPTPSLQTLRQRRQSHWAFFASLSCSQRYRAVLNDLVQEAVAGEELDDTDKSYMKLCQGHVRRFPQGVQWHSRRRNHHARNSDAYPHRLL